MKFTRFLADRRASILCFVLFMIFISLVVHLDGSIKVGMGNIIYINLVSFFFFIVYIIARYFYYKGYYKGLADIAENQRDEIIDRLPMPKNNEQILFHKVMASLNSRHNSELQRLYEQKKDYEEFITSWVHQVKTPIAVGRLLIEHNSNSPAKETLESIEEELGKIENSIEQALYYSKTDDFSKDYFINEAELDRLVKDAVKKQAKTFINKKINIEIQNVDLLVITDKKWLAFIIDQILSNSLKYTDSGGNIKIYGIKEEKVQKLVIEDNGTGIKREDLERVFDKGFTGYNGRENHKATGIGLYLSRKLAEKLGHDISIESEYGKYTKVTIVFPKLHGNSLKDFFA